MKPLPPYICVLDLETGGKFPGPILEIGMVVVTTDELKWMGEFSAIVKQDDLEAVKTSVNEVVLTMHTENGLWDDLEDATVDIQGVDNDAEAWLRGIVGTGHIALSGSGVSHFDREFLKWYMPRLNKHFAYWHLDVGNERRMMQLAGRDDLIPKITEDVGGPLKTHRALDDAYTHLVELEGYVDLFANIGGNR